MYCSFESVYKEPNSGNLNCSENQTGSEIKTSTEIKSSSEKKKL